MSSSPDGDVPSITRCKRPALSANGLLGVRVTLSVAASYFADRSLTTAALPDDETLLVRIGQMVDPGLVRLGGVDLAAEGHIDLRHHVPACSWRVRRSER